jgi:hypothetical protein
MLPSKNIQSIVGATLYGADKVKLGRITQVYVDATDGHPTWAEVLMEERLVVRKEKVPGARVRLEKTTVTEQREVAADVQKERIEVERDEPRP